MSGILDWMDELVEKFWDKICDFMPGDPFTDLILQLKHGSLSVYVSSIIKHTEIRQKECTGIRQ